MGEEGLPSAPSPRAAAARNNSVPPAENASHPPRNLVADPRPALTRGPIPASLAGRPPACAPHHGDPRAAGAARSGAGLERAAREGEEAEAGGEEEEEEGWRPGSPSRVREGGLCLGQGALPMSSSRGRGRQSQGRCEGRGLGGERSGGPVFLAISGAGGWG